MSKTELTEMKNAEIKNSKVKNTETKNTKTKNTEIENTKTKCTGTKKIEIRMLREFPDYKEQAARWFSQKWGIPLSAYLESMEQCVSQKTGVPQWYFILNQKQELLAGAGVIENDFHNRPDLHPNLCALFVEEPFRNQGIARCLLDYIRKDMGRMGFDRLYLVTDHTDFYERCGWNFFTMVKGDDGCQTRLYMAETGEAAAAS